MSPQSLSRSSENVQRVIELNFGSAAGAGPRYADVPNERVRTEADVPEGRVYAKCHGVTVLMEKGRSVSVHQDVVCQTYVEWGLLNGEEAADRGIARPRRKGARQ